MATKIKKVTKREFFDADFCEGYSKYMVEPFGDGYVDICLYFVQDDNRFIINEFMNEDSYKSSVKIARKGLEQMRKYLALYEQGLDEIEEYFGNPTEKSEDSSDKWVRENL